MIIPTESNQQKPIYRNLRSERGSMAVLLLAAVLLSIVGIGAFGMDTSHNVTVRTELQSATDSGALAGAHDLLTTQTQNNADEDALLVASKNTADGTTVSNLSNGIMVTTSSTFDPATNSGTCVVDASKQINNIFAKLFGHDSDTVSTHSVAQCWNSITGLEPNQAFPLIASLDTTNGSPDGKALYQRNIGESVTFWINSQQYKNAAWTAFTADNSTNANWLKNAIDQALGFAPQQPGFIPALNTGDSVTLANGIMSEKSLANPDYQTALENKDATFVIPVMQGDPPYNSTKQVVGFITVKFNSIKINGNGGKVESLTATLAKGLTKGVGGVISSTNSAAQNAALNALSAGTVKLVQ